MGAAMGRARAEERDWGDLHAELLVEMLSYLPQRDRIEAMTVNRSRERAVREGSVLWKKVNVHREWITIGDAEPGGVEGKTDFLSRLLGGAEEVSLAGSICDDSRISAQALNRVLGVKLRVLKLPGQYIDPSFFLGLESDLPQLESLLVIKEPVGGAHRDHASVIRAIGDAVAAALAEFDGKSGFEVKKQRQDRFLEIGRSL